MSQLEDRVKILGDKLARNAPAWETKVELAQGYVVVKGINKATGEMIETHVNVFTITDSYFTSDSLAESIIGKWEAQELRLEGQVCAK